MYDDQYTKLPHAAQAQASQMKSTLESPLQFLQHPPRQPHLECQVRGKRFQPGKILMYWLYYCQKSRKYPGLLDVSCTKSLSWFEVNMHELWVQSAHQCSKVSQLPETLLWASETQQTSHNTSTVKSGSWRALWSPIVPSSQPTPYILMCTSLSLCPNPDHGQDSQSNLRYNSWDLSSHSL